MFTAEKYETIIIFGEIERTRQEEVMLIYLILRYTIFEIEKASLNSLWISTY